MAVGDWPDSVEQWRPLLMQYAGDVPVDFLLAWINYESGGNPCSMTSLGEWGIFQLMGVQADGNPNTNLTEAGATIAGLTPMCNPRRVSTPDEMTYQVTTGMTYVNAERQIARDYLTARGVTWPDTSADFWAFVKLHHTLPSLYKGIDIATQNLGRPPASWDEFVDNGAGSMYGGSKWLPFAAKIGLWGDGGGTISVTPGASTSWLVAAGLLGLAIGAFLTSRLGRKNPI